VAFVRGFGNFGQGEYLPLAQSTVGLGVSFFIMRGRKKTG